MMTKEDRIYAQYKANKDKNDQFEHIWIQLARNWKMSCKCIKEIVQRMKPEAKPREVIEEVPFEFKNKLTRMLTKLGFVLVHVTTKVASRGTLPIGENRYIPGMVYTHPQYENVEIKVYYDDTWECSLHKGIRYSSIVQPFISKEHVRSILEPTILNPLFRASKISKLLSED